MALSVRVDGLGNFGERRQRRGGENKGRVEAGERMGGRGMGRRPKPESVRGRHRRRFGAGDNLQGGVRIRDIIRTGYAQVINTLTA